MTDGKNNLSSMSPDEKLYMYLKANRPIIYIHHFDFQTVDNMIGTKGRKALGGEKVCRIEEFSNAGGWIDFKTKSSKKSLSGQTLEGFLERYNTSQYDEDRNNYLVVLKEVHAQLDNPRVISLLQTIARRSKIASESDEKDSQGFPLHKYRVQVVMVSSQMTIPPELEKLVTVIEVRPPDDERIGKIVDEVVCRGKIVMSDNFRPELVLAFKGLSEFEIRQILELAIVPKKLDERALALIHDEKRQMIQKSGLLELVEADVGDVGGLKNLCAFIDDYKCIFQKPGLAKQHGVDAPSGVMIVGMPGCGKSLMAKTVAKKFGVPLLKLDVGRLMGKYVGESENNLHRAIAVAESAAPCVLWIDEIEKAFSGIGGEGGGASAMTRMFGIFLTWMQEKTACVYVVATANNIDRLPPEFLRRGRFDEIFQVGYPNAEERKQILELHVRKRNGGNLPTGVDLNRVSAAFANDENYSGADIESIVKEAMKQVFVRFMRGSQNQSLTTNDLVDVIRNTKSSYHSQKDKLDAMLKQLKNLDAKSAT